MLDCGKKALLLWTKGKQQKTKVLSGVPFLIKARKLQNYDNSESWRQYSEPWVFFWQHICVHYCKYIFLSPSIGSLYIQLNISFKSECICLPDFFFEVFLKAYKKLDSLSLYSVSSSKKVWSKLTFSQKE